LVQSQTNTRNDQLFNTKWSRKIMQINSLTKLCCAQDIDLDPDLVLWRELCSIRIGNYFT
jgi:hypothetical protein